MSVTEKQKQLFILGLFFIASVFLWNTFLLYPVKLFVVFLHEMSHGLMAILFGGSIIKIQIDPAIGGYCQYTTTGGFWSQFFIASAGYLGSLFWGALILGIAIKIQKDRYISLTIGIIMLIFSVFVIRTGEKFGIIFCFLFSFFMIFSFRYLGPTFHDYFHKFIGLTSCLYSIVDMKEDLVDRVHEGSDAYVIGKLIGIPSKVVGIIWIVISLIFLYRFFRRIFKTNKEKQESVQ